ncbi:hypothetical protein IT575_04705 [bacterium]|nr:hypothetical protein [bacterium]
MDKAGTDGRQSLRLKIYTPHPGPEYTAHSAAQYPDTAAENRVFALLGGLWLFIIVLLGLAVLYLGSPASRNLHIGKLERMYGVREFYEQPPAEAMEKPLYLGIGDSVTISGFNGYAFDKAAGGRAVSYNLSIPAKVNPEYLFDLAEPLLARATVISFVTPATTFANDAAHLDQRKSNMYRVLGYKVDTAAWQAYDQRLPDQDVDYLMLPRWRHVLDSRWRFQESAFEGIEDPAAALAGKARLDGGIEGVSYSEDLKHPSVPGIYTPERTRRSLERRIRANPGLLDSGWGPAQEALAAFDYRVQALEAGVPQVVLVIIPLHPLIRERIGEEGLAHFKRTVQAYSSEKTTVLDLTEVFGEEGFRDDVHISDEASITLSEAIVRELGI